jgi:protein-arginine kinase
MGNPDASASMMRVGKKTRINNANLTISKLQKMVDMISSIETRRRDDLMENAEAMSLIHRSWGILTNSIELSESETLRPMSWWVAGINAGIESCVEINNIKKLIVHSMTGHLNHIGDPSKCEKQLRAEQIRNLLLGRSEMKLG